MSILSAFCILEMLLSKILRCSLLLALIYNKNPSELNLKGHNLFVCTKPLNTRMAVLKLKLIYEISQGLKIFS